MKARGNRDQIVLATKYTIGYKNVEQDIKLKVSLNSIYAGFITMDAQSLLIQVNYQGNHRKSLVLSVEDSLKKLQTDYIDLLYLHMCAEFAPHSSTGLIGIP